MDARGKLNSHAVYIVGKIYRVMKPLKLDPEQDFRILDESGEDYLYPSRWFVPIEVPPHAKRALAAVM